MAKAPQRSRAEQRAISRTAILNAAVDCLLTDGYAGTTTVAVQTRAAVNRGTLLHYFPSRAALLVGAVDHLFAKRREELHELTLGLPANGPRVDAAIDLLWATAHSPLVAATLQLWIASVNDPELADALRAHTRSFAEQTARMFDALFGPQLTAHPRYPAVRDLLSHAVRGAGIAMALGGAATPPPEFSLDGWKEIIHTLLDVPSN